MRGPTVAMRARPLNKPPQRRFRAWRNVCRHHVKSVGKEQRRPACADDARPNNGDPANGLVLRHVTSPSGFRRMRCR